MRHRKGSAYERVVATVLKAMDPNATIRRGQWVSGPDGVRELDVVVEGTVDGQNRRILVECKDFNPTSTGPVGIAHVDALESKKRDLKIDFTAICSNAGFTEGATRKASRVGIGLISVMRKGDKRIRFSVTEEIYTRKVTLEQLNVTLNGPEPINLNDIQYEEIAFCGIPIANWVSHRVMIFIVSNPIVNGAYKATHSLIQPIELTHPLGSLIITNLDFRLRISGGWYAQVVTLDATNGIYDWLRHRVRLAPGPGNFMINGVDIYAGNPIPMPPERELKRIKDSRAGEYNVSLILIFGLEIHKPIPDLDRYINSDDLNPFITDLPEDDYISINTE